MFKSLKLKSRKGLVNIVLAAMSVMTFKLHLFKKVNKEIQLSEKPERPFKGCSNLNRQISTPKQWPQQNTVII